jgi:RNA-directed DNA polymerase
MEIQSSRSVSTKLNRVAELARQAPKMSFTSLSHHIDIEWLREAYRRTRKDGAVGIDRVSAKDYAADLETNLQSLLNRAKSGSYRAPAVRRVMIPKGKGKEYRPIGIPTFEDKILQRAVSMVLEAVYEQDFYDFSYGFRPKRSAHQALEELRNRMMDMHGGVVLELDIRKFFDTLDHRHLREILSKRIRDGVIVRLIGKWLKAGVMHEGKLQRNSGGTPQGGVISPILANVYLHEVLDKWFVTEVQPRMKGQTHLIRYADDAVMVFSNEFDAKRVFETLPKRLEKYSLTLHPDKTRLVQFERPPKNGKPPKGPDRTGSNSFDLLGFTHYWGRSLKGNWVIQRKTAKSRFARAVSNINEWCRKNRHMLITDQWEQLCRKLRGHYNYYGIPGNSDSISRFRHCVRRIWRRWLSRRSQRGWVNWEKMAMILKRFPLPLPNVWNPHIPLILRACNPRSRMR